MQAADGSFPLFNGTGPTPWIPCGRLFSEMKLEDSGGVKAMTDEQIERSIKFIKEQLAKREAGANAKVIEGVAEPVRTTRPRRERSGS